MPYLCTCMHIHIHTQALMPYLDVVEYMHVYMYVYAQALMPYLDVVAPNETELGFISGIETRRDDGSCDLRLVRRAVRVRK